MRINIPREKTVAAAVLLAMAYGTSAVAASLSVSEIPLFVASGLKPNVMLTVANSNSMDEDATGLAVGSAATSSRSEIARRVAKNLVVNYGGALKMGLMAFQQNTAGGDAVRAQELHSSPYDVSFDPANYNATYTGDRDSPTKRFREENASWPTHYLYYNVNLPFYAGSNQGNGFCFSPTANAFNNGENPVTGPWDSYRCYNSAQTAVDTLPTAASAAGLGWTANFYNGAFLPTDSDLGQGITDFGRFITWRHVSKTWFSNGSPGGGYVHVPIAVVDSGHATKMNTKLGTSQFVTNGPVDATRPLQNAGLTPLEGTLYTIKDYFQGNLTDTARGGLLPAPPNSCNKDFSVILTNGLPSVTRFGVPSSNVVTLLADATTAAAAARTAGVENYVVGFALPFGVNPAQLDTIAAAGGTVSSYYATDEATLTTKLNAVFNDILERSGAAGAVALNSGSIQTNSHIFQAKFNTGSWSGQLQSFPIDSSTGAIGASDWDAGAQINALNWDTGRTILSYNPDSLQGVPFRWSAAAAATTLSATQLATLATDSFGTPDAFGSLRTEYLRGSAANEGNTATSFRKRLVSKLGDIVNSSPAYVQKPSLNLADPTYVAFKAAKAARPEMVYVGANDGMLHGFLASTGVEKLAYVPSSVFSRLSGLAAQGFSHKYLVDGSPFVADIKFSGGWRTVLASGLNGGGRGLFALNVTDPSAFSEASAASTVLWEYTSLNDADLGLTYAQPILMKLNDGSPGVIVGNGYNNTLTGRAKLFILNAETGALIRKIDTGVGSVGTPNGLSTTAVVDMDGNGTADYAYAGDLRGNVWKFDLSDGSSASWGVAYGGAFFHATDGLGNAQPITSAIEVSRHPSGGVMLLFGTGQYIQSSDVSSAAVQSLYGVRDNGVVVADRGSLEAQSVIEVKTVTSGSYRAVSGNAVNWGTKYGWFMDLPDTGERVVVDPILRNGRFIVPTTVPSSDPCAVGGYSWLMEVDYLTGGRLNKPVFDVDGNGVINDEDIVSYTVAGDLHASGMRIDAIASSPSVVRGFGSDGGLENKYLNQSTGGIARVLESGQPLSNRRMSWRQIL